jgi:hypothetical protein
MHPDPDRHEWSSVPDSVPREWVERYGSTSSPGRPRRRVINPDRRADTRAPVLALALCIGVFVVAIVGTVLPAQGMRGLAVAAGLLAAVAAGSVLMTRLMIDGRTRRRRPGASH